MNPELLNQLRLLQMLIQHHEAIIQNLKNQQLDLLGVEDKSKNYVLDLETGELTDASE